MAERKIGDTTYAVDPLLAKRAIVLQAKLMKVLGPALPSLIKAFSADDDQARALASVSALEAMSANIEPEAFGDLVQEVVELAQIMDGGRYRRVIMDQDFTDSLADIVPVASFVLEVNFADFFAGLLSNGARKKRAAA